MRCLKLIAALALAAATAACAAKPIVARDPVPAPARGESFVCDSRPTMLNAFHTDCESLERSGRGVVAVKG